MDDFLEILRENNIRVLEQSVQIETGGCAGAVWRQPGLLTNLLDEGLEVLGRAQMIRLILLGWSQGGQEQMFREVVDEQGASPGGIVAQPFPLAVKVVILTQFDPRTFQVRQFPAGPAR